MTETIALFAPIESNNRNKNAQCNITSIERRFEDEAIRCFTDWRKNAGYLSDIPIYAVCPTKNGVADSTVDALKQLNVTYIHEYHQETDLLTSGFLNAPFVGRLLERQHVADVLIKIDLDMNLLRPLPAEFLCMDSVLCGQYDNFCTKQQRGQQFDGTNPFDTGFVISHSRLRFYEHWMGLVQQLLDDPNSDPDWLAVRQQTGEYYLEEYAVDRLFSQRVVPITPIQRYQLGEWYTPVSMFTDEELKSVYFWHEHLIPDPAYDRIRQRVEWFNRSRKLKL